MTPVTIRFAHAHDGVALAALAQLDSAKPLTSPAIVAEVDGRLRAALSLVDSAVIADPFQLTGELVELLHVRAEQLTAKPPARLATLRSPLRLARALGLQPRSW